MKPGPGEATSEQTLIERAREGDRAAFNGLVERYQHRAYALALRMLGNPDAAADVTQDAFISAFRAISSFRGGGFQTWLFRIVANGCYDYHRARNRHPSVSLDEALEREQTPDVVPGQESRLSDELVEQYWEPERSALRGETIALLERLLQRLPAEQRIAVILCDIQGMAYEEIAQVTDASLGTVKSRISRARAHLRVLLTAEGELSGRQRRPEGEPSMAERRNITE
jgi:RNA polymerase sigma-70 factor (ECF subfamily)